MSSTAAGAVPTLTVTGTMMSFNSGNNLTFALSILVGTLVLTAEPQLVRDVILTHWPLEPSISTGILQVSAAADRHMMVGFTLIALLPVRTYIQVGVLVTMITPQRQGRAWQLHMLQV